MNDVYTAGHCNLHLPTLSLAAATQETEQLVLEVYCSRVYGSVSCHSHIILGLYAAQVKLTRSSQKWPMKQNIYICSKSIFY